MFLLITVCYIASNTNAIEPPPITPIEEFYELGNSPNVPADWHLIVDGAVEKPLSLTLEDIAQYPTKTEMSTLECHFPVGPGLLVSNGNWTGVSLNTILQDANMLPEAASLNFYALDFWKMGLFSLDELQSRDDILLAYGLNGETLPMIQGYPLKLVLPGIAGYQNVRWLQRIEITTLESNMPLNHYPIHARIIDPSFGDILPIGTNRIYGMANAGEGIEITKVEISVNGGNTWEPAEILNYFVPNVWKTWEYIWDANEIGSHTIYVRTEDSSGNPQREEIGDFGWRGFDVVVSIDYDDDIDRTADSVDNCVGIYNPSQSDSDGDGIGNACDTDCPNLDAFNPVDLIDFSLLVNEWQQTGPFLIADLNMNEVVDANDLLILAKYWLSGCYEE